jgi:6-pyruvoyltetrahydropterin/6-carboxytetrahydropterin synthase
MFEAEVSVFFRFSHSLKGFGEKFEKIHEHTWDVTVRLATAALDQRGVSVDFTKLKENLGKLLEPFQGKLLNDCEAFRELQPTAERIAIWVAGKLEKTYPGLIHAVTVGTGEERARFILQGS